MFFRFIFSCLVQQRRMALSTQSVQQYSFRSKEIVIFWPCLAANAMAMAIITITATMSQKKTNPGY